MASNQVQQVARKPIKIKLYIGHNNRDFGRK